jgi:hypothetical protein
MAKAVVGGLSNPFPDDLREGELRPYVFLLAQAQMLATPHKQRSLMATSGRGSVRWQSSKNTSPAAKRSQRLFQALTISGQRTIPLVHANRLQKARHYDLSVSSTPTTTSEG